jgi:hypothetical protein
MIFEPRNNMYSSESALNYIVGVTGTTEQNKIQIFFKHRIIFLTGGTGFLDIHSTNREVIEGMQNSSRTFWDSF